MRGSVDGLLNPHQMGDQLPAPYQEDEFAQRFVAAFDTVLAPVVCTLDNLEAYVEPRLAPPDFLGWLACWLGTSLDETWPVDRQRDQLVATSEHYRWRGTAQDLAATVGLYVGTTPEIIESGAATWSPAPGGALPGDGTPHVTVRVTVADPSVVNSRRLEALVASSVPAHVPFTVEVVKS